MPGTLEARHQAQAEELSVELQARVHEARAALRELDSQLAVIGLLARSRTTKTARLVG